MNVFLPSCSVCALKSRTISLLNSAPEPSRETLGLIQRFSVPPSVPCDTSPIGLTCVDRLSGSGFTGRVRSKAQLHEVAPKLVFGDSFACKRKESLL